VPDRGPDPPALRVNACEIEWLDSASWNDWRDVEWYVKKATREQLLHRSCGYVLADNEDAIMLALSLTDDEDERDRMAAEVMLIPRVAILKVKELRFDA
jgi:hypothetical protein